MELFLTIIFFIGIAAYIGWELAIRYNNYKIIQELFNKEKDKLYDSLQKSMYAKINDKFDNLSNMIFEINNRVNNNIEKILKNISDNTNVKQERGTENEDSGNSN